MIGLALGKRRAGELNYSSIDPILLTIRDAATPRARQPGEAAQRYARNRALLSEVTSEGYVFASICGCDPLPK